jgi:hypothetical protein
VSDLFKEGERTRWAAQENFFRGPRASTARVGMLLEIVREESEKRAIEKRIKERGNE